MLEQFQLKLGGSLEIEWTMLNGPDKLIPDVTFSFPAPKLSDGYLVAPAFLVVEAASKDQSLSSLLRNAATSITLSARLIAGLSTRKRK